MTRQLTAALFPLGRIFITREAQGQLHINDVVDALNRHVRGDLGVLIRPRQDWYNSLGAQGFNIKIESLYPTNGVVMQVTTDVKAGKTIIQMADEIESLQRRQRNMENWIKWTTEPFEMELKTDMSESPGTEPVTPDSQAA